MYTFRTRCLDVDGDMDPDPDPTISSAWTDRASSGGRLGVGAFSRIHHVPQPPRASLAMNEERKAQALERKGMPQSFGWSFPLRFLGDDGVAGESEMFMRRNQCPRSSLSRSRVW